jgi:hypothetical protein
MGCTGNTAVYVVHVNVVGVIPTNRPRLDKSKGVAAVLETGISTDQDRIADAEFVPATEVGAEAIIGDSSAAPADLRLPRKRSEFVRAFWFVLICTVVGTAMAFSVLWIGESLARRHHKISSPMVPARIANVESTSRSESETAIAASHPITPRGVHDL